MERRGTGSAVPDWRTRLSMELRRDKRKTFILVTLVLAGAVLGGRMLVKGFGPSKASALQKAAPTAKIAVTPLAVPGTPSTSARDEYIANIKPGITRDLFKLSPELFPLTEPVKTAVKPKATTQPAKTDKEALRKRRVAAITAGVWSQAGKQLNVQSTITGSSPMAIINGKLLRAGDRIGGFKLVAVTSRTCEVEKTVEYIIDEEAQTRGKLVVRVTIEIRDLRSKTGAG